MHQSVPAVPYPPGNFGAFARLFSPGGEALANLVRPRGRALANHGGSPEKFGLNVYFTLKKHNIEANSETVYKLLRFATGHI